jgi:hypothetical protein
MDLNPILKSLHYAGSPNFVVGNALDLDRDFGHIFRKARAECNLEGAYVLNAAAYGNSQGMQYLSLSWLALDGFVCIPDFALSVMLVETYYRGRYKFLIISIGSSAICQLYKQSQLTQDPCGRS